MSHSARLGEPPNTEDDYYIVKAILQKFHLHGVDPAKGIHLGHRPLSIQNDTRGPQVITGSIVCIVLVVLITGSRLLIRALHPKVKWGWDDWLIIPGAGFTIAWFATYILYALYAGAGKHIYNLTYHEYHLFNMISEISMLIFLTASTCIKLSLTLFIRRLIGLSSRFWIWVNNVFLALLCVYLVVFLFWDSFRCVPVAANFSLITAGKLDQPLRCRSINPGSAVRVYSHVAFDFCLLCTPAIILWKVQMSNAKKLRIFVTFSIGSVSCIGSVMTLVAEDHLDTTDDTFNFTYMMTWITIDLFFGILVASAPILPAQLFNSCSALSGHFKTRFGSHSSKGDSLQGSPGKDSSMAEVKKTHGHDDLEREYAATPKREYDLESGDKRLSDDQRSLESSLHSNT